MDPILAVVLEMLLSQALFNSQFVNNYFNLVFDDPDYDLMRKVMGLNRHTVDVLLELLWLVRDVRAGGEAGNRKQKQETVK